MSFNTLLLIYDHQLIHVRIKIVFKWRTFRENLCGIFDAVFKKVLQVESNQTTGTDFQISQSSEDNLRCPGVVP